MKWAPESVQSSLDAFFESSAADLEMTVENLSVSLACLPQSRNQHARSVARVLSYTSTVLLPTLTSLFQHLGLQNFGRDLLGEGFCDAHLEVPTNQIKLNIPSFGLFSSVCCGKGCTSGFHTPEVTQELLLSTLPFRSLKLALIKGLCHGHRATGAYFSLTNVLTSQDSSISRMCCRPASLSSVASACSPFQPFPCFSSGDYPGVVLQDPQQPLLSWNNQQHLHGRVHHSSIVVLFLQFLSFCKCDQRSLFLKSF